MQYQSQIVSATSLDDPLVRQVVAMDKIENNPDVLIVSPKEGKASISIAQVHAMIAFAQQKPFSHTHKAVVLFPAHQLTVAAQQALLKTLEEPPENTRVVLVTPTPQALLPTILSRCDITVSQSVDTHDTDASTPEREKILDGNLRYSECIEIAKVAGESKESAIRWITMLLASIQAADPHKRILVQKKLLDSLTLLQKNINPKLVLEHFLFDYLNGGTKHPQGKNE